MLPVRPSHERLSEFGDVLEEDKQVCFEVCLGPTIDNTGNVCVIGSIPELTEWTDGVPLVAQGARARVVDLGFFPVSNTCGGTEFP